MTAPRLTALGLLALLLPGCQYFERMSECRKLSRIVNPTLAALDGERRKVPETSATFRGIAAAYERLASAVGGALPRGKPLGDVGQEYQTLFREAAQDARAYAEALDSRDPRRVSAVRVASARTTKHEAQLLARTGATCARR